jgi:branched-chain amino acid aminotransferase
MFWFQEQLYSASTLPFDIRDRGLMLGDGVFDTSLVLNGVMIDRAVHVARITDHAAQIGIVLDSTMIDRAIEALISGKDGLLRLTATRGIGQRGIAPSPEAIPSLLASLSPVDKSGFFQPVRLWVTSIRRNDTSPLSRIKSINYLDAVLAQRDAIEAGADEAVFFNTKNRLCCAASGNIFVLDSENLIKTPPLSDGVMDGTIRHWLLKQGFGIQEQSLDEHDLQTAQGVFITNSRRLIAPASHLGGQSFAPNGFEAICQELRDYLAHQSGRRV